MTTDINDLDIEKSFRKLTFNESMESLTPAKALSSHKEEIIKKYPQAAKFKNVTFENRTFFIEEVAKKFSSEIKNSVHGGSNSIETPVVYYLEKEDFFVVAEYYPLLKEHVMLIFYDDKDKVIDIFKDKSLFYNHGIYALEASSFGYKLRTLPLSIEEEPILNEDLGTSLTKDISVFFKKEKFYKDNKLAYKRGVLLYGSPGNGKSSIIKSVLKEHSKDSFCLMIDCTRDFHLDVSEFINIVCKDSKKIVVFEDVDGIESYARSAFLNFIDGISVIENMFVIATTNDITKVDSALVNRPSRFDRIYHIGLPNEDSRSKLLKKFFPELSDEELEKNVKLSDGFSGAYFKELFIHKNLNECSLEESISSVKKQLALFKNDKDVDYLC